MTPSAVAAPSGVAHVTPAAILPAAHDHPTIGFPLSLEPLTRIRWVIHRLNTCTGLPRYRDRVTTPANSQSEHKYLPSGRNHIRAAEKLQSAALEEQKTHLTGPADHLAGVGAECVIKAIMVDFLDCEYETSDKPPNLPGNGKARLGHLPRLWDEFVTLAQGRTALGQFLMHTPFQDWVVDDRYDHTRIKPAALARHVAAARRLLIAYQNEQQQRGIPGT